MAHYVIINKISGINKEKNYGHLEYLRYSFGISSLMRHFKAYKSADEVKDEDQDEDIDLEDDRNGDNLPISFLAFQINNNQGN